ncbi:MAG TPA: SCO family protein [Steroidobacteraceae bacterium]|jgi:protein SCO1/2|nr:SCO family protein [Steroidobacteraceae bacterium]
MRPPSHSESRRGPSRAIALLAGLLLCAAPRAAPADALKAGVFDPPREAPDFSLQGSDGKALTLSRYRGKVVLLGFGYTSCRSVCPVTLAILAMARRKLGPLADRAQVIYLTVDPERDDTGRLKRFLASFDASFIGGTGTVGQMAAVRKSYGVTAEKIGTGSDYAVAHSSFIYLITREGKLRALMPYGHTADDFAHDVSVLLN